MTIARRELKVKVMGQPNAVDLTSIEGSVSIVIDGFVCNSSYGLFVRLFPAMLAFVEHKSVFTYLCLLNNSAFCSFQCFDIDGWNLDHGRKDTQPITTPCH